MNENENNDYTISNGNTDDFNDDRQKTTPLKTYRGIETINNLENNPDGSNTKADRKK